MGAKEDSRAAEVDEESGLEKVREVKWKKSQVVDLA